MRNGLGFIHDISRKFQIQAHGVGDGENVHVFVVGIAQDLHDFSLGLFIGLGEFFNVHDDFLAVFGAVFPFLWNENVVRDSFVVGNDETETHGVVVNADDAVICPLENGNDLAFAPLVRILGGNLFHQYSVFVHGGVHLGAVNV